MPPSFLITTRPARLLSMEQEVTSGGSRIATSLGVPRYGYHGGSGRPGSGLAGLRVEADSSCDSELIYSRFDLTERRDAETFAGTVSHLDSMRADGAITYGTRAGLHVHVDASGAEFAALRSLYLVFNHLEDALYRLAYAGYRNHRDESTGNGYAAPTRKGLRAATDLHRWGRGSRGGLNLSNYLQAMVSCTCGAGNIGAWGECGCTHGVRTVEFRLWNATTRPRKVHAYVSLSHALMEWALRHPNVNPDRLPERPYRVGAALAGDSRKALRFILAQLQLSAEERASVLWTVRRSTLHAAIGAEFFGRLESEFGADDDGSDASPEMEMALARRGDEFPPDEDENDHPF